jgi:hypothetical protein
MRDTRFSEEEQVGGLVVRKSAPRWARRRRASDPTLGWAAEVRAVAERIGAETKSARPRRVA